MIVKLELRKQEARVRSEDGSVMVHMTAAMARRRLIGRSVAYFHAELTRGNPQLDGKGVPVPFPDGAQTWLEIGDEIKNQSW